MTKGGNYYCEKGRRRKRLVRIEGKDPCGDSFVIVSVCGRDGEEHSNHRTRVLAGHLLRKRDDKIEMNRGCMWARSPFSSANTLRGSHV